MGHVQDTTRRRRADSWRPLARLRRWLVPLAPRGLVHHVLNLWPGSINDDQAASAARDVLGLVLANRGGPPAWAHLECGAGGGLHLHIVSPDPLLLLPWHGQRRRGGWVAFSRPVHDLGALVAYLSKPKDSRLCRPGQHDDPRQRAADFRAALDEAGAARAARLAVGVRRAPARTWSVRPAPSWRHPGPPAAAPWRLLLLVAVALALLALAANWRPLAAPRRRPGPGCPSARRRGPGGALVRSWRWSGGVGSRGCSPAA